MQTAKDLQTVKECNKHLSGYDLTTLLLRGGLSKLGLNSNAKLVLTYLATCYNEKNGSVYPRVKTMSEALEISERGIIRALAELTEKGCIIRSKRGRNTNIYVITNKVLNLANNDTTKRQDDTTSNDIMSLPCHEVKQHEVKEQQQTKEVKPVKNVVAFSSFSSFKKYKSIKLEDVPNIIKDNKNIKNPCGYWASLDENAKNEYIEKEKQKEEIRLKKIEFEKQEELRKIQEQKELEEIRKQPPFWETCNRQEAIKHLRNFKNMRQLLHTGYRQMLIDKYNIDVKIEVLQ